MSTIKLFGRYSLCMTIASSFLAGCGGGGGGQSSATSPTVGSANELNTFIAGDATDTDTLLSPKIATTTTTALPTDSIFAPTSFWYQPIPASTPLHPNSANFVAEFLRQKAAYYTTVGLNTSSYASPVYKAGTTTQTKQVSFWDCQRKGYVPTDLTAQWNAVPIPDGSLPANGTDAEMTVHQPSTDSLWEFWQTRSIDGQWSACWGGRMQNVSASSGIWPAPYGTTATGLPFIGGQITAEELKRGEIRHVIGISLVEAEHFTTLSWPANRSDGHNPTNAPNRIPQGTRFRLNPAVNLDTLNLHPVGKIIAKAAQTYGFVVWDKAGALTLRLQNPKSYTVLGQPDPYPALFNGKPAYAILNNVPWDQLQFMPMNYGKP
ncbi:MAG: DUF4124 domain-containing protein [Pseudomonadota bacterium]